MITTLCSGLPVEVFVPDTAQSSQRRHLANNPPALVLATCTECPVKERCLDFGRTTQSSGWWGGVLLHEGRPASEPKVGPSYSKLTADIVKEIRTTYAAGGVTQTFLAKRYGVDLCTINSDRQPQVLGRR